MSADKLQDHMSYAPKGLRAERAAAYVGMSRTVFLDAVAEGKMPKPKRYRGSVIWDRLELDAAFETLDDEKKNSGVVRVRDLLLTQSMGKTTK